MNPDSTSGASTLGEGAASGRGRLPVRPIPTAWSILWRPAAEGARPETDPYPIFVLQPVLAAVQDHLGSAPDKALLGFLVGRVLQCPDTHVPYVLVDRAVRVPQMLAGDSSDPVMAQSIVAVQRMLRPSDGEVIGWYHSHPGYDPVLSPDDRAGHVRHFPHAWQFALVLSIGGQETLGGFFRAGIGSTTPVSHLPFFEVVDPRECRGGWKRSTVSWSNYFSRDPAVWPISAVPSPELRTEFQAGPPPRSGAASGRPSFIPPAAFNATEDDEDPAARGTRPVARPLWQRVLAAIGAGAIALVVAVVIWLAVYGSPEPSPPVLSQPPRPRAAAAVSADSVYRAIEAYQLRAGLFATHQMTCDDLAKGFAQVDAAWVQYNVGLAGAAARDSAQPADDQALLRSVGDIERAFEGTGCPRP